MKLKRLAFSVVLLAVGAAAPAVAHHSAAATYQATEKVEIKGKVVQFLLRNPHSFIHVMAPDKDGNMQRWAVEWGPSTGLGRDRVTSATLKPGDEVVIVGHPGRVDADHRIGLTKIVRPSDGWTWKGLFE